MPLPLRDQRVAAWFLFVMPVGMLMMALVGDSTVVEDVGVALATAGVTTILFASLVKGSYPRREGRQLVAIMAISGVAVLCLWALVRRA